MKSKALSFDEITTGIDKVLSNAEALVEDARVLLAAGRIARAYTLSHLACEELAKVPMLYRVGVQVLVGIPSDWPTFWKRLRDHKEKLRNEALMQVAELTMRFGKRVPGLLVAAMPRFIDAKNDLKNLSLYVSFTEDRFLAPSDVISLDDAECLMLLASRALANTQWHAATLKTLATTPQERVRATFLALEARLRELDRRTLIDYLLEISVALHRIAPQFFADNLNDEPGLIPTVLGPDHHGSVNTEDAGPESA